MKKLALILILLLAVSTAFGQRVTNKDVIGKLSCTLDSTDTDTIVFPIPKILGTTASKGVISFLVWCDSLKTNSMQDSIAITYREAWKDTTGTYGEMTQITGGPTALTYAQIYQGASAAATDFLGDGTVLCYNKKRFRVLVDMDGVNYRFIQFIILNQGGKNLTSTASNDSIRVNIELDVD